MAYILAFAGSNSSTSINYKLVKYTASLIEDVPVKLMDMAHCPFPMFSEDHEREQGYSNALREIMKDIRQADGLLISVNEHNGAPSSYFKNLLDWLSRLDRRFMADKHILLLATSGGKRGAIGALGHAEQLLTRFGAEITATFSLPLFHDHFSESDGIVNAQLAKEHKEALAHFMESIHS